MAARGTPWLGRPKLLWTLCSHVRLASRLLREPRVPHRAKAVPLLALLYLVSPLDLIPDALLVLGQVDDLSLLLAAFGAFSRLCPAAAVAFHRAAIAEGRPYTPMAPADDVIDAEWRRE